MRQDQGRGTWGHVWRPEGLPRHTASSTAPAQDTDLTAAQQDGGAWDSSG